MKTPYVAINKARPADARASAIFVARMLKACTMPCPVIPVRAAIAIMPAKPTNPAVAAGALFPASPAFAAGAARPAFPAISSPLIKGVPGFGPNLVDEIATDIVVKLPLLSGANAIGADSTWVSTLKRIGEITEPALEIKEWVGTPSSGVVQTVDTETPTAEKYFYKKAVEAGATVVDGTITLPGGGVIACKVVTLALSGGGGGPT